MNFLRKRVEKWYEKNRDRIFEKTKDDPELAHEDFVRRSRLIDRFGLSNLLLDNNSNYLCSLIELSNAAGFNKNGLIPPKFLEYLGFDRIVVGTVTHEAYSGNPKPRMWRFSSTESLVNWLGLPGQGSKQVARNLDYFGHHSPVTINLTSTPGKTGKDILYDLKKTILDLRDSSFVDRWELNISCPNTSCDIGTNSRKEYIDDLKKMCETVYSNFGCHQEMDVKVSPDLDEDSVDSIIEASKEINIRNFTTANTTTFHDPKYIWASPKKGGASGRAVYDRAFRVQKMFEERLKEEQGINACGGIDSVKRLTERLTKNVTGIQIFTPLIYKGPKIVREFRRHLYSLN